MDPTTRVMMRSTEMAAELWPKSQPCGLKQEEAILHERGLQKTWNYRMASKIKHLGKHKYLRQMMTEKRGKKEKNS